MITTDLDDLSRELAEVRDWRDELVARLTQSMAELQASGKAPAADLLHSIREYRRRFEALEQDLLAVPEIQAQRPKAGLDEWEQAIKSVVKQRHLTAMMREVRRLEFHGTDSAGLLKRVFADADELQFAVRDGSNAATEELIAGRHPLAALLGLIRGGDDLADEVWTDLQDRVTARYGRELSTAVARGRLRLSEPAVDGHEQAHEVMS